MRFYLLLFLFFLGTFLYGQRDTLLSVVEWKEQGGETILRLQPHGAFEEDAGEDFTRSSRYLMGRWNYADSTATLTLSVDYFMGTNMVDARYREGRDFYLRYKVILLNGTTLEIEDIRTGKTRSFASRPISAGPDASERRKPKPTFKAELTLPKLPTGWGG